MTMYLQAIEIFINDNDLDDIQWESIWIAKPYWKETWSGKNFSYPVDIEASFKVKATNLTASQRRALKAIFGKTEGHVRFLAKSGSPEYGFTFSGEAFVTTYSNSVGGEVAVKMSLNIDEPTVCVRIESTKKESFEKLSSWGKESLEKTIADATAKLAKGGETKVSYDYTCDPVDVAEEF